MIKFLTELLELDEALIDLARSDSSVEYAPHIREPFNLVVDKLNKLKEEMKFESIIIDKNKYFSDEE